MIRNIYAILDVKSSLCDSIDVTHDTPTRYVAQVNRIAKMRELPVLMLADQEIFHLGTIDDETLELVKFDKPVSIGDYSQAIEWLERKQADAQSNPKPF